MDGFVISSCFAIIPIIPKQVVLTKKKKKKKKDSYRQYNVNNLSSEGWGVCPPHLTHGEQQQCHT